MYELLAGGPTPVASTGRAKDRSQNREINSQTIRENEVIVGEKEKKQQAFEELRAANGDPAAEKVWGEKWPIYNREIQAADIQQKTAEIDLYNKELEKYAHVESQSDLDELNAGVPEEDRQFDDFDTLQRQSGQLRNATGHKERILETKTALNAAKPGTPEHAKAELDAEAAEENLRLYEVAVEAEEAKVKAAQALVEAETKYKLAQAKDLGTPDAADVGGPLVTLVHKDGTRRSFRRDSPTVDELIDTGEWTTAAMQTQELPEFEEKQEPRAPVDFGDAEGLYQMAEWMTGPTSTLTSYLASPIAWVTGGKVIPEEVVESRMRAKLANQDLVKALRNSKKYPEGEQNRIIEYVNISPKFWDSPAELQVRMKTIDSKLKIDLQQTIADSNDKSLPPELRGDARIRSAAIRNFIEQLNIPSDELSTRERDELAQLESKEATR
jgi:hypothetical protein